jgi:hypothetical protein
MCIKGQPYCSYCCRVWWWWSWRNKMRDVIGLKCPWIRSKGARLCEHEEKPRTLCPSLWEQAVTWSAERPLLHYITDHLRWMGVNPQFTRGTDPQPNRCCARSSMHQGCKWRHSQMLHHLTNVLLVSDCVCLSDTVEKRLAVVHNNRHTDEGRATWPEELWFDSR